MRFNCYSGAHTGSAVDLYRHGNVNVHIQFVMRRWYGRPTTHLFNRTFCMATSLIKIAFRYRKPFVNSKSLIHNDYSIRCVCVCTWFDWFWSSCVTGKSCVILNYHYYWSSNKKVFHFLLFSLFYFSFLLHMHTDLNELIREIPFKYRMNVFLRVSNVTKTSIHQIPIWWWMVTKRKISVQLTIYFCVFACACVWSNINRLDDVVSKLFVDEWSNVDSKMEKQKENNKLVSVVLWYCTAYCSGTFVVRSSSSTTHNQRQTNEWIKQWLMDTHRIEWTKLSSVSCSL